MSESSLVVCDASAKYLTGCLYLWVVRQV